MHLLWKLNIYTVTYIIIKLLFLYICVRILIGSSIRIQKEKLIHALPSRRGIRRCSWSTVRAVRSLGHIFFHAQCLLHGCGILRLTKQLFYKMPKFHNATSFSLLCLGFHACIFLISDSSIAGSDGNVLKQVWSFEVICFCLEMWPRWDFFLDFAPWNPPCLVDEHTPW